MIESSYQLGGMKYEINLSGKYRLNIETNKPVWFYVICLGFVWDLTGFSRLCHG